MPTNTLVFTLWTRNKIISKRPTGKHYTEFRSQNISMYWSDNGLISEQKHVAITNELYQLKLLADILLYDCRLEEGLKMALLHDVFIL